MRSSLLHKFSCARCASEYVGSTIRPLHTRVAEHAGRSFRTGSHLTVPPHPNVRQHALLCGVQDNMRQHIRQHALLCGVQDNMHYYVVSQCL